MYLISRFIIQGNIYLLQLKSILVHFKQILYLKSKRLLPLQNMLRYVHIAWHTNGN